MTENDIARWEEMALKVREHVIRMSTDGGCFIGSALSCTDLIVYLYTQYLNVRENNLDDPNRDYFFLSKGHAVPALYGTFVELGLLELDRLRNHLRAADSIYWHPNRDIPGIEFHSGSLGHLLAVAVGVALDCKLRQQTCPELCRRANRVVVLTGDGELNEGANWEACLVASAYGLDNLVIVVDRNRFQANVRTEGLIPLEPLAQKFEAFGCRTAPVDGHSFADLNEMFARIPFAAGRPSAVIAETVRGRGVPSIENRADRWLYEFSHQEAAELIEELHRNK